VLRQTWRHHCRTVAPRQRELQAGAFMGRPRWPEQETARKSMGETVPPGLGLVKQKLALCPIPWQPSRQGPCDVVHSLFLRNRVYLPRHCRTRPQASNSSPPTAYRSSAVAPIADRKPACLRARGSQCCPSARLLPSCQPATGRRGAGSVRNSFRNGASNGPTSL